MAEEQERCLASFPAGEQTIWADISPLFNAACNELQVGELVHGESFSLFEAMSALEIMDPKMDAGMATCGFNSVEEAIESGAAPIHLSVLQTIDVMDHLLACEATWHKGHSLAQTVFSCLYLLNLERTLPNALLHSYCRVIRRTCNIIRSAVSESRTHEEEDFFTMAFGLPLKGEGDDKSLSMLNAVEETVARQLRASKTSVTKTKVAEDYEPLQLDPNLEEGYCKAILSRLRFRKLLLVRDGKLFGQDPLSDVICRAMNIPQLANNQDFRRNNLVIQLGRLSLNLLRILCTNAAWQRRKLGKSLQEWGALLHQIEMTRNSQWEITSSGPDDKGLWMMSMMGWAEEQTCWIAARFLMLGFELDLYSPSEYCMIYWYLDHVLLTLMHYKLSKERPTEKERHKMSQAMDLFMREVQFGPKEFSALLYSCSSSKVFIQNFELLQKSQVPEPLSYLQFEQSTINMNLPLQYDYFGAAQKRQCFAKDSQRLDEIRQMDQVAEHNRIALNVIHLAGHGDSFLRVSFEFSQHPCFAVAVIKRS